MMKKTYYELSDAIKNALAYAHSLAADIDGPDVDARVENRKTPNCLGDRLAQDMQDILLLTHDLGVKLAHIKARFVRDKPAE